MCNRPHTCFKTQEVTTNAAIVKLVDVAEIRESRLRSIMLRRLGSATGISATGATLAPDSVIATAHLVLVNSRNVQVMNPMPMQLLQRDYNFPEPYQLDPAVYAGIDLSRSYIILSTSAAGYSATNVIELVFEYECDVCKV
jgi:hypothetical protein